MGEVVVQEAAAEAGGLVGGVRRGGVLMER